MLEQLKQDVCNANLDLVAKGVVIYTWGNVSGISDDRKYMVIKPSGVDYDGTHNVDVANTLAILEANEHAIYDPPGFDRLYPERI